MAEPHHLRHRRPKGAVFLDRDGTLIEDHGHLRSPSEVVFFPETLPALRRLQPHFQLFIVTNQSGVSKGELTLQEVDEVNAQVVETLRAGGVAISAVYVCPHQRAENCACHKPRPFFLQRAVAEHGIDLARSYSIGDHLHDLELADHAGGTGIYVLTGHGLKHWPEVFGRAVVTMHIGEAADWILSREAETALESRPTERHGGQSVTARR